MAEGSILHNDILDNPEDDTLRLIYADWLEDHRQYERAEFIRVQVELAKTTTEIYLDPDDTEDRIIQRRLNWLRDSERRLLTPNSFWDWFASQPNGWLRAWPGSPKVGIDGGQCTVGYYQDKNETRWHMTIHRGFITRVELPHDAWIKYGKSICLTSPIDGVRLSDVCPSTLGFDRIPEGIKIFYSWQTQYPGCSGLISPEIHKYLAGFTQQPGNGKDWKDYGSCEDAIDAISKACILYGKSEEE